MPVLQHLPELPLSILSPCTAAPTMLRPGLARLLLGPTALPSSRAQGLGEAGSTTPNRWALLGTAGHCSSRCPPSPCTRCCYCPAGCCHVQWHPWQKGLSGTHRSHQGCAALLYKHRVTPAPLYTQPQQAVCGKKLTASAGKCWEAWLQSAQHPVHQRQPEQNQSDDTDLFLKGQSNLKHNVMARGSVNLGRCD